MSGSKAGESLPSGGSSESSALSEEGAGWKAGSASSVCGAPSRGCASPEAASVTVKRMGSVSESASFFVLKVKTMRPSCGAVRPFSAV